MPPKKSSAKASSRSGSRSMSVSGSRSRSVSVTASKPKNKSKPRSSKGKKVKDPNAPKRPLTAFQQFLIAKGAEMRQQNPGMKQTEVAVKVGEMWRAMSSKEKIALGANPDTVDKGKSKSKSKSGSKKGGKKAAPARAAAKSASRTASNKKKPAAAKSKSKSKSKAKKPAAKKSVDSEWSSASSMSSMSMSTGTQRMDPEQRVYRNMNMKQLKDLARENGLKNYSSLKHDDLADMIWHAMTHPASHKKRAASRSASKSKSKSKSKSRSSSKTKKPAQKKAKKESSAPAGKVMQMVEAIEKKENKLNEMTVAQLRDHIKSKGWAAPPSNARKADLIAMIESNE